MNKQTHVEHNMVDARAICARAATMCLMLLVIIASGSCDHNFYN